MSVKPLSRCSLVLLAAVLATHAVARASSVPPVSTGLVRGTPVQLLEKAFRDHGANAQILVAAHRAYWRGAPENSLAGIQAAIDLKIPMVELDCQRTQDGQLILMHDTSVNRTTNGSGNIASMSLQQIQALRLRKGLGGGEAPLTYEKVPTLDQAFALANGKILLQLDKCWDYHEQAYDQAVAAGVLGQVVFKSTAAPADVEAFLARDPNILYMHILDDANAGDFHGFSTYMPQAFEIDFDRLTDAQIQPDYVDEISTQSRIFINTMWRGLAAGYTDELSLRDPALGWEPVIDRYHASVVQTDNPVALMRYLSGPNGTGAQAYQIVVEAEDYEPDGKDVGYHDLDDANQGGNIYRPYEGVDIGDNQGAINVAWIRGGEWIKYRFDVPRAGTYQVAARVSSPHNPPGLFSLEFDGDGLPLNLKVVTTTSFDAFESQDVGKPRYLAAGTHEMLFLVDPNAPQNFNVDRFELTLQ